MAKLIQIILFALGIFSIAALPLEISSQSDMNDVEVPDEELLVLPAKPKKLQNSVNLHSESQATEPAKIVFIPLQLNSNDSKEDQQDGEILEGAHAMVFRPLFTYRKSVAQRRRVYRPPSRRSGYYYYYPRYSY